MDRLGAINRLYFDTRQKGSCAGLSVTERYLKGDVKSWLIRHDTYTLHKTRNHRFRCRQTLTKGINDLRQTDLVDV